MRNACGDPLFRRISVLTREGVGCESDYREIFSPSGIRDACGNNLQRAIDRISVTKWHRNVGRSMASERHTKIVRRQIAANATCRSSYRVIRKEITSELNAPGTFERARARMRASHVTCPEFRREYWDSPRGRNPKSRVLMRGRVNNQRSPGGKTNRFPTTVTANDN